MINRIAAMSPAEWANEYKALDARYRRAELDGKHRLAEHIGDMLSDMEMHQPDYLAVQTLDNYPAFLADQAQ